MKLQHFAVLLSQPKDSYKNELKIVKTYTCRFQLVPTDLNGTTYSMCVRAYGIQILTLSSMQCQLVEMSFTAGRPLVATAPSFFSMSVRGSFGLGGRPRPLLIGNSLNFEPRGNLRG